MRLSDQQAGYVRRRHALGDNEWMVDFHPSSATRRKDPALPGIITARLLHYQKPGFRASWLLTSLHDPQAYTHAELVDLYPRRWQIETIYREWKHNLNIQNLRSHTPAGIVKEIYAHLLLSNLVRWVMSDAANDLDTHPIDLSYVTSLTHINSAILRMLRANPKSLSSIYQELLSDIRCARIRKRPGRSYPRRFDWPKNLGHGHIRQPAKLPNP